MQSLTTQLSDVVGQAFAELGLDKSWGKVGESQRPELSQFQCNGAMAAAKQARKPPRELAQQVLETLEKSEIFDQITIEGPGFINLTLTDVALAKHAEQQLSDDRLGVPTTTTGEKVIIDYGGANIAKPMHVGHLRAHIIGDALCRIFKFAGYDVLGDAHLGDWGLQMGLIIAELEDRHSDWAYFDANKTNDFPEESPVTIDDLAEIYPAAAARSKQDENFAQAARQATAELQEGRPGYRALWQHFVDVSLADLKRNYEVLNIDFDLWYGEAIVNDRIPGLIDRLKQDGHAVESDDALIFPLDKVETKEPMPPLLLLKADGAVLYSTTDLATIDMRVQELDRDLMLYVVDARQALHFKQVFAAAKLSSVANGAALEHIKFGTMNGTDGKPFKTREGGVMRLGDLIDMVTTEAKTRVLVMHDNDELKEQEVNDIAQRVGVAAVKFADLMHDRISDYVFEPKQFFAFEGCTGPYLQYSAVRIAGILKKADTDLDNLHIESLSDENERALMIRLALLPNAIETTIKHRAPHHLCAFAYQLAKDFNRFYENCPVISEQDVIKRKSRLALVQLTLKQLQLTLDLLGIEIPSRM